jgi:putative ABC transport system permease protein
MVMKNKIRLTNSLRNIRNSLNRFLSIAAIVALGTGFLAGLVSTTPDMEDAMDKFMDDCAWYDIDVQNTLGFSDDDVAKIKKAPYVEKVQPAYVTDAILVSKEQVRYTTRIFGYLDSPVPQVRNEKKGRRSTVLSSCGMNNLVLLSGRFPERTDECVVQSPSGYAGTLPQPGETITFLNNASDYSAATLTVTGIVKNPMFISAESEPSLKGSGSVTLAVYVLKSFYTRSSYTDVYVTVKGAASLSTWSASYKELVQKTADELTEVCAPLAAEKIASLKQKMSFVSDEMEKVVEAQNKLAQDEVFRARQSQQVIALLESHGVSKDDPLIKNIALTADSVQKSLPIHHTSLPFVNEFASELSLLEQHGDSVWGVHTRNGNTGYASYQSNIEKIAAMSKVFPVFFYLIAMLVSLTTMTRLVEERRNETGTLKALGFSNWQLLSEYIWYALAATIFGSIVGLSIGFQLFPKVINNAYGMMYALPPVETPFRWNIALVAGSTAVVCILFATIAACLTETTATPAVLMTPKAPSPGKRILLEHIPFIWKRIPFSGKVTARNLFRYKKRLYMTVIGIAGCSALLTAGFGLHDSIYDIVKKQFGAINKYDVSLMMSSESAVQNDETVRTFLNDATTVTSWMQYASENGHIMHGDKSQPLSICVPKNPQTLSSFVSLHGRLSHKMIPFTKDGIIITEKLCEQLGVKSGDTVLLENGEGVKAEVKVLDGAENYVYAYAYLYPQTYQTLFGKTPLYTSALCKLTAEKNNDESITRIMSSPSVLYALSTKNLKNNAYKTMSSINIVVIVLILSSGILSMVVLFNLANINICERKREIATLLVLGYNEREARRYIFREIDILSFMGIVFGLFLGVPLHRFVVSTLEVNAAMWGRTIYPLSFICAAGISVCFTFLVNLIMRKTLRRIDMVESMKTTD